MLRYNLVSKYIVGLRFFKRSTYPEGINASISWFQIHSGLLSRIHPICKAMGLVNTHTQWIWKVLWRLFGTSGPFTARTPLCCRPGWCRVVPRPRRSDLRVLWRPFLRPGLRSSVILVVIPSLISKPLEVLATQSGWNLQQTLGFHLTSVSQVAWAGQKLLKKSPQNMITFFVPRDIPVLAASEFFFKLCLDTRGRSNHFAQSLNFELKFFLDNHFMTKIGSRVLWIHFFPRNLVRMAKN